MNGVTIIDKVVAVPIWLLIILGLIFLLCLILTYWLCIDEYPSRYLMVCISVLFLVIVILAWCNNYDGYKIIISEDTKMEKFYTDWEIKDTQGKIYYVIPKSKDSIEMTKEWDRNNG